MYLRYNFKYSPFLIVIFFIICFIVNEDKACTVFCIDKGGVLVTGRSYDWSFGEGLVVVNKRGQFKTALTYWNDDKNNLAAWTTKYGSITFVQYGRDIAFDGMNEAGLFVSELWLDESVYPNVDLRPSLSLDQYVQYLLDNFSSVDEIIASDSTIRVRPTPSNFTKIHFFAADSSGNCVVIEFINGKMVFHTKDTMPVKAITNHTYENSINYFNRGVPPSPGSNGSLERFYRTADMISKFDPAVSGNVIDYTFNILNAVKAGTWTKFQTAFDIKNRIIYFKSLQNMQLRFFNFNAFDFSCNTASMMLDINENLSGDVTDNFTEYRTDANEKLIKEAWEDLGSTNIYQPALEIISRYPETFECSETTGSNEGGNLIPERMELNQNFPNPFNPSTTIGYSINFPGNVELSVFNSLGQKIQTLKNEYINAGKYFTVWYGRDFMKNPVSSGIYFYRLTINNKSLIKKMILLK